MANKRYSNEEIYHNEKVSTVLSVISLSVAIIIMIMDFLCRAFVNEKGTFKIDSEYVIILYLISIGVPALNLLPCYNLMDLDEETEGSNNLIKKRVQIIFNSSPWIAFALYWFVAFFILITENENHLGLVPIMAEYLGRMSVSLGFVYVGNLFLIKNCTLIKEERAENPPKYIVERNQRIAEEQREEEEEKAHEKYLEAKAESENLITKCGIKFFIKYYYQLKNLPLADVTVIEDYTSEEKYRRLNAAKKIIDDGLTEITLTGIINKYSGIIDEFVIEQAKKILDSIKGINS
ncbi:MAG TPA: hypothetical protein DHU65_05270 [Clostridiales bacterium]|nr:hypothetical protein [Clostridiales bacterium]